MIERRKNYLLLIGGCPHSGSSVVTDFLNADKDIAISNNANLLKLISFFSAREPDFSNPKANDGTLQSDTFRNEANQAIFNSQNFNLSRLQYATAAVAGTREQVLSSRFNNGITPSLNNLNKILNLTYSLVSRDYDKPAIQIMGDKFSQYFAYTDYLLNLPLEIKYIHITRNPFDVANSMLKNNNYNYHRADVINGMWSLAWESINSHHLKDNVLHIQYEDFVFRHEEVAHIMSDFLGHEIKSSYKVRRDISQHFKREALTEEVTKQIQSNPAVRQYKKFLEDNGLGIASQGYLPDLYLDNNFDLISQKSTAMSVILHEIAASGLYVKDNYAVKYAIAEKQLKEKNQQLEVISAELMRMLNESKSRTANYKPVAIDTPQPVAIKEAPVVHPAQVAMARQLERIFDYEEIDA